MSRSLRGLLLGTIAIAFAYLVVHAREPLRLDLGDPQGDANLTGVPALFYGGVGRLLGTTAVGAFRPFALAWSGLALALLFAYVRALYSSRVAMIATALFSTSLWWMMYADSLSAAPIMTAMVFLALWGLARALATGSALYCMSGALGTFGAFVTSTDCYVLMLVAIAVTTYLKSERGRRWPAAICTAACVFGIVTKVTLLGGYPVFAEQSVSEALIPTLTRRLTLVFTPLVWVAIVIHALQAIRSPSLGAALRNTAAWLLAPALVFVAVMPSFAAERVLASHVFLPFYAIGSALLIDRWLDRSSGARRFGLGWLVLAPLWCFGVMVTQPRSFLSPDDVARTNAYLASNDHNAFVLSNLLSDDVIRATFHRDAKPAPDKADTSGASREMLRVFATTDVESIYAFIFKGRDSRFIDTALFQLAAPRKKWSVTGFPHLHRAKAGSLIADYDRRVAKNLDAVRATKVLQLHDFALYRIDRSGLYAQLAERLAASDHIDFAQVEASQHLVVGWEKPHLLEAEQQAVATVENAHAELAIRIDRPCDAHVIVGFARPSYARVTIARSSALVAGGRTIMLSIPASELSAGLHVIRIDALLPREVSPVHVTSVDVASSCGSP